MKLWSLTLVFLSTLASAHEVMLNSQVVGIKRQHQTGHQHDLLARISLSEKFDVGAQGTYFERFDLFEKRVGGLVTWRPRQDLSLELRHFQGDDNEILPERETDLILYHALARGLSPFLVFKDAGYGSTRLYMMRLGTEIEKWAGIILIPQITYGKATFYSPAETRDVHNYGLRAIYYKEKSWSLFAFAYTGKEAAQTIIGSSSLLVDTLSGGLGGGFYLTPALSAKLSIDHTDYEQLDNQFITTVFNLKWTTP